jgi:hypothetical protein
MEEKIPVNGDHSTMVKFDSKKNTTYESAVKRLNDCLEAQRPKHFVPMPSSDGNFRMVQSKVPAKKSLTERKDSKERNEQPSPTRPWFPFRKSS